MSQFVQPPARSQYAWWVLAAVAIVVVAVTLVSTLKSRKDSYGLLVQQATAFTEALALACQNTVVSESYYDRLTSEHYQHLADDLTAGDARRLTETDLTKFVRERGLYGGYVYDSTGRLLQSAVAPGPVIRPPAVVDTAVHKLLVDFATRSVTVFLDDTTSGYKVHYYIEVTNQLDRVIVLAVDATLYDEARDRTGIGVLAQNMAAEPGIEYILYQSVEGIIVSSRRNGSFEAIESDPFLTQALDADSMMTRRTVFQEKEILELVRPFATRKYPFGLLRVGTSLDGFVAVSRGFDRLMLVLAIALFGLTAIGILYMSGRKERAVLRKDISEIRSISEQIFAEISTGVVVIGPDGRIRLANRAIEKMVGVTLGNRLIVDIAADLPPGLANLTGKDSDIEECEIRATAGERERVLLVGRSVLSVEGETNAGVVLVVTDITQLKEYEVAAARKERLSEMGHLAAAVAHEIRNPLNAISIAAQRLESEVAPGDRREEFINFTGQIRSETKRLNEIITRFLSLARVGSMSSGKADVPACLVEFESLVAAEALRLGIRLQVQSQPDIYAAVESTRLKEILLNLYNNAKEALIPDTVTQKEIVINASHRDGVIRISVADSGPGIPKEHRARVFAPYFTTKEGGTGIGLAAVHQTIQGVGGTVAVEESDLGGALIMVVLPEAVI
jgi:signal transduction histidine kinase